MRIECFIQSANGECFYTVSEDSHWMTLAAGQAGTRSLSVRDLAFRANGPAHLPSGTCWAHNLPVGTMLTHAMPPSNWWDSEVGGISCFQVTIPLPSHSLCAMKWEREEISDDGDGSVTLALHSLNEYTIYTVMGSGHITPKYGMLAD